MHVDSVSQYDKLFREGWRQEAAPAYTKLDHNAADRRYPDGNPKTANGTAKPSTYAIPPVALLHLGAAMEEGKEKYGLYNWRDQPVTASVYINAAERHLLAWRDGEDLDPKSPGGRVPHLAKAMACLAIMLDAEAQGTLTVDRGTPGRAAVLIDQLEAKN